LAAAGTLAAAVPWVEMLIAALDARASAMKAAPVKMENVLFMVFSFHWKHRLKCVVSVGTHEYAGQERPTKRECDLLNRSDGYG
jgi:hypothetical protein